MCYYIVMKEDTYTIYMHISPSNKVYVGITSIKPEYRWNNGNGYKHNKHFWSAIQKYGWNNFRHIIICENLAENWAYKLEQDFIRIYKSNDPNYGYNSSIGGEIISLGARYKRGHFSESHRKALSEAWQYRKEKGLGTPWNKGVSLKESGKLDNFINAGKQNAKNSRKPVLQYDLKTGETLNEFSSISEAAKYLGKSYTSSIVDAVLGKRKSAFGYGWKEL